MSRIVIFTRLILTLAICDDQTYIELHTYIPLWRGNETGKVAIAHGSVEFCEATPIGLADES